MPSILKTNSTLILGFRGKTLTLSLNDPKAAKALDLIAKKASDDEIMLAVDIGQVINQHPDGLFSYADNTVFVQGEKLPSSLGFRVLDFHESGLPVQPLLLFWENCKKNPDPRAKSDLYAFLEHNGHPITNDGCFIAYRYVHELPDGRYVDNHTKTMDNSIGQRVKMDRSKCDPNPNVTCSTGLHCAAYEYARGNGNLVVEVKVNPKDVVAIPVDYNGQKMRVCEFVVIAKNERIHTTPFVQLPHDPSLDQDEDEGGATSEPAGEEAVGVAAGLDFSQKQNEAESDAAKRIDTRENHKSQKRDARGHFIKNGNSKRSRKARSKSKSRRK